MILIPKYQNALQLSGSLSIVLLDEEMKLKQEVYVPNTIVTAGRNHIANRLGVASPDTRMSFMAIGTGSTAVAAGDTALGTEVGTRISMSGTSGANSVAVSGATVTYSATFIAGNPASEAVLREAGIFNASSAGTMLCRTVFPIVTKQTGDTLTITWAVTVS
jgi:hypothetical protein